MSDESNPTARLVFLCGAAFVFSAEKAEGWRAHEKRNGRIRLAVIDTERRDPPLRRPLVEGEQAGCLIGCPTRKYRRQFRALSDGPDAFTPRLVVTCSAVLEVTP